MTMVARFSRQNDAGLRALTVVLRENLVVVVVLVLESKALYLKPRRSLKIKRGLNLGGGGGGGKRFLYST